MKTKNQELQSSKQDYNACFVICFVGMIAAILLLVTGFIVLDDDLLNSPMWAALLILTLMITGVLFSAHKLSVIEKAEEALEMKGFSAV